MDKDVHHPSHYTSHPSGVECIDITRHMGFCEGNALKYIWRAGLKGTANPITDLKKAVQYLEWAIEDREAKHLEEVGAKEADHKRDFEEQCAYVKTELDKAEKRQNMKTNFGEMPPRLDEIRGADPLKSRVGFMDEQDPAPQPQLTEEEQKAAAKRLFELREKSHKHFPPSPRAG